ncbi:DNA binding domain-containing protein, excisionase family [Pseudonocardia thermophila]|jgi:DNA binding domain, excisionase family|uniref:DNA binding domain-containing protein, excisionase family n=1 Tax=Pseudonocardia thermophila TaxID=1848 RepID=A0A1M6XWN6_PSETH|nr:helix-turn-helix domain-containing protein [Pseudonocardia thermophila]SHL10289.1 DNA binding domain-containing protein, excisionase family [Pseudonocardia thermophila]
MSAGTWLTVSEACRALGMSRTTLLAAEEAGTLVAHRTPGGHRRYHVDDIARFLGRAPDPVPHHEPAPDPGAQVAPAVRAAVRPLVQLLDADCAGLYLEGPDGLHFSGAFGVPRWLSEQLAEAPPPAPVTAAAADTRPHLFDPAAEQFPEPRATGRGLTLGLRDAEPTSVLFLVRRSPDEFLPAELRIVDALATLLATVVTDRCHIADLEARLARIARLTEARQV